MFGNLFGTLAFITFWLSVLVLYIGFYGIGIIGIILAFTFGALAVKADKTLS